jgi:membrane-associated phospholipid phosphatase
MRPIVGVLLLVSSAGPLYAQTSSDQLNNTAATLSSSGVADLPQGKPEQVAVGEESGKSNRGFARALFHNLADDLKHIPRRNSLYWLGAGAAMSAAIHPADDYINEHLAGSDFADTFFAPGKYIGSFPVMLGASFSTYLVGRKRHIGWVQHLGMDLIEATLLSEGITQGLKVAIRRDRPLRADGTRASGYSFPSGHAAVTFATATVFQQHFGWKAAVPTYLVASYVAMSRLHDERHFASDVTAGAAEGIIIGRSVTFHGRNYFASPMLVPGGVGVGVMVMR